MKQMVLEWRRGGRKHVWRNTPKSIKYKSRIPDIISSTHIPDSSSHILWCSVISWYLRRTRYHTVPADVRSLWLAMPLPSSLLGMIMWIIYDSNYPIDIDQVSYIIAVIMAICRIGKGSHVFQEGSVFEWKLELNLTQGLVCARLIRSE